MTCDATAQFEVSWPRTRINTEYRSVLPHLHIDDVIAVMAVIAVTVLLLLLILLLLLLWLLWLLLLVLLVWLLLLLLVLLSIFFFPVFKNSFTLN